MYIPSLCYSLQSTRVITCVPLCAGASHTPDKERVKGEVYSNIKVAVELLNGCLMSSSTYPRPSPWGGERAL